MTDFKRKSQPQDPEGAEAEAAARASRKAPEGTVDGPETAARRRAALEKLADESVTTMTTEIDPATALEAAVPDADLPTLEPLLETFEAEAEAIVEAEEEEAKIEEARVTSSSVKYPAPGPIVAPSSPPPAPPAQGI